MVADLIDWIKMSLIFHYVNVHLRRGGGSSKWSFEVDHHKIICHFICPKKAAATRPPHQSRLHCSCARLFFLCHAKFLCQLGRRLFLLPNLLIGIENLWN